MSTLQRLARQLVDSLGARAPDALGVPVPLDEIQQRILPYRACRRLLGILSVEEYEILLMRLVAGEAGLASAAPAGAGERCRAELDTGHPDPKVLHELEGVALRLNLGAIAVGSLVEDDAPASIMRSYQLAESEDQAGSAPTDAEVERGTADEVTGKGREPAGEMPASVPFPVPMPDTDADAIVTEAGQVEEPAEPGPDAAATPAQPASEPPVGPPAEPEPTGGPGEAHEPVSTPPEGATFHPEAMEHAEPVPPPLIEVPAVPGAVTEEPLPPPGEPPLAPHPQPPPRCPHCASRLPRGRPVRFCPHCGSNVVPLQCIRCGADLEPAWRHCVLCGAPAMHDSRFA